MVQNLKKSIKRNSVPSHSRLLFSGCPCSSPQFYFANSEDVIGKLSKMTRFNLNERDLF